MARLKRSQVGITADTRQLDLFVPDPKSLAVHNELVTHVTATTADLVKFVTRVSPNTGGPLSAAEAERVIGRRSALMIGRVIITDREYFACQPCVQKFIVDPGRGEPDPARPWPAGPCNYRQVWEGQAATARGYTCVWCDKKVKGEE